MDIQQLKSKIIDKNNNSNILLLEKLSDETGFFTSNQKLIYMMKDSFNYSYANIETEYLKLQTHIYIKAIENQQSFPNGYYNLIVYSADIDNVNFEAFTQLCIVHSRNLNELNFRDFFYSLISLFQLPDEQGFKNVLGLYGELKFIQYIHKLTNKDISKNWHTTGPQSRYDFISYNNCLEVKTTLSNNLAFMLNHKQVFNSDACTIATVQCEAHPNGETLEELINTLYSNKHLCNNISFTINIAMELKRISLHSQKEERFRVRDIKMYDSSFINPFRKIPYNVDNISYKLDFTDYSPLSKFEIQKIIDKF